MVASNAVLVLELTNSNSENEITQIKKEEMNLTSFLTSSLIDSYNFTPDTTQIFPISLLLKDALASLHITGNSDLDFVFYIDLNRNTSFNSGFVKFLSEIKSNSKFKLTERVYQNVKLYEVGFDKKIINYVIDENRLVLSTKAFLIEDVIRLGAENYEEGFFNNNQDLNSMPKLSNDNGNIYVNFEKLDRLIEVFNVDRYAGKLSFAKNGFLDLWIEENKINLNGFTNTSKTDFLNTFIGQTPVTDNFNYFIPNDASNVAKYLISDGMKWYDALKLYWLKNDSDYLLKRNDFFKTYNFNDEELFKIIKTGLCHIEFLDKTTESSLIFINMSDVNQALNVFNTISENVAIAKGDSVYIEKYGSFQIQEIVLTDFPKMLLGSQFGGFETTFYMILDDNLVLSNSIETLKKLVNSLENENTWARSVKFNSFITGGLEETNLSYYYNLQRIWPRLANGFKEKWKKKNIENIAISKSLNFASVQFSRVDDNYYTNIALQFEPKISSIEKASFNYTQRLAFENQLITKPYVVKNHNTNSLEVLVQDSLNNIHLISTEGEKLWSVDLQNRIVGKIDQIDFYKNKKLQYLFASENSIYLMDRIGGMVEQYPIKVDYKIQDVIAVDYDNSKNYRFLTYDDRGNLYLYNKEGKLLEGWNPKKLTNRLASKPFHIRVRGKDCFVALQQDGQLFLFNRKGELKKGFPLKLDARFDGDVFVEMGIDYSKTYLHLVSRNGRLFKVNLNGEIIKTEELYKQSVDTRFKIITDALGKSFVIARQEGNRLVIIDKELNEVLSKDYLDSNDLNIQFYLFGPEKHVYVVTDPVQGFTYLYDKKGDLISSTPLDSDKEIGILYSESKDEFTVYSVSDFTFNLMSF